MNYPLLLQLTTAAEYRDHFEIVYCRGPITAFDGIEVHFRKRDFNHSFFESSHRDGNKDIFSHKRAERMDWIKAALRDANADRYLGWDKSRRAYTRSRRVTVVMNNYVVVIGISGPTKADFVTAFVADTPAPTGIPSTLDKIKSGPKWT